MTTYPLEGIRVIDLGWVYAGPTLGHMLGDMGAEVIRVESHQRVDSLRMTPENVTRDPEKDPMFHDVNRNKLGITVNITFPDGVELIKKLVKISDLFVENFGPAVLSKRGIVYEELKKINERLIMVSMPGVASSGPLAHVRSYNPTLMSLCGLDSLIGYPGDRPLRTAGIDLDPNSAMYAFIAVLAALHYRDKTGKGQYIETPQMEMSIATLGSEAILRYTATGEVIEPHGNRESNMAPHNNYPCRGDDKWVSIAIRTEEEWKGLCKAMGEPAWSQERRFADLASRLKNLEELDQLIGKWTCNLGPSEAVDILQKHGVASAPLADIIERLFDPHFEERGLYYQAEHLTTGSDWIVNSPWDLSETPPKFFRPSPMMGQHNEYVFNELLGMDLSEVKRLIDAGVID